MIKAVIYDMDGVLIDSEPLWRKAEIESFKTVGIQLSEEMCSQTMGLRVDEVSAYWAHNMPQHPFSESDMTTLISKTILKKVKAEGRALRGVQESLQFFKKKHLRIALASSSSMELIRTVVKKLEIDSYFEFLYSAEVEKFGKPHPDVYIHTLEKLGIHPQEGIAIEDSANGIIAAKAAKLKVIAVPETSLFQDKRFGVADVVLHSLSDISDNVLSSFNK